jgi:hypothetical protein
MARAPWLRVLLVLCAMNMAATPAVVRAAPTGAALTQELLAGAGAAAYVLAYEAALKHIKGSYDEAELTVTSRSIATFAYLNIAQSDCASVRIAPDHNCRTHGQRVPTAYTLRNIRDELAGQVGSKWNANADRPPTWRKYYEDYSVCYRQVMFAPESPAAAAQAFDDAAGVPDKAGAADKAGAKDNGALHAGVPQPATTGRISARKTLAGPSSREPSATAPPAPESGVRASTDEKKARMPHAANAPPKPGAAEPAPALAVKPVPAPAPTAGPTLKAGCDQLIVDFITTYPSSVADAAGFGRHAARGAMREPVVNPALLYPVDGTDLAQSLLRAPSLLEQVNDENVGAYGGENAVRIAFLIRSGAELLYLISPNDYPAITKKRSGGGTSASEALGDSDYASLYSNCAAAAAFGAVSCLASISALEKKMETSRRRKIACDWGRSMWLPTYSALQIFPADRRYWGAPPGC